ncbi:helix-turn-helix domain-containing protein [Nonomuraea rhodomycinica]|uniref:Helix-turn-helix domain-containing protein n=1 Tax=Nonomuraea rhodomycinica TaxID=1712872 RepID=A0A7Y6IY71_9ACTN|nr:helix-turn-helix domain-containing protein [Nonomuraea rhodomycinica]
MRRPEAAQLAGASAEHRSRLERGEPSGASDHVLDALARLLRLNVAPRTHLEDLTRTSVSGRRSRGAKGAVTKDARARGNARNGDRGNARGMSKWAAWRGRRGRG